MHFSWRLLLSSHSQIDEIRVGCDFIQDLVLLPCLRGREIPTETLLCNIQGGSAPQNGVETPSPLISYNGRFFQLISHSMKVSLACNNGIIVSFGRCVHRGVAWFPGQIIPTRITASRMRALRPCQRPRARESKSRSRHDSRCEPEFSGSLLGRIGGMTSRNTHANRTRFGFCLKEGSENFLRVGDDVGPSEPGLTSLSP